MFLCLGKEISLKGWINRLHVVLSSSYGTCGDCYDSTYSITKDSYQSWKYVFFLPWTLSVYKYAVQVFLLAELVTLYCYNYICSVLTQMLSTWGLCSASLISIKNVHNACLPTSTYISAQNTHPPFLSLGSFCAIYILLFLFHSHKYYPTKSVLSIKSYWSVQSEEFNLFISLLWISIQT